MDAHSLPQRHMQRPPPPPTPRAASLGLGSRGRCIFPGSLPFHRATLMVVALQAKDQTRAQMPAVRGAVWEHSLLAPMTFGKLDLDCGAEERPGSWMWAQSLLLGGSRRPDRGSWSGGQSCLSLHTLQV